MRRHLINIAATLSWLLCVLAVASNAQFNSFPHGAFSGKAARDAAPAAGYTGPGDVLGSALMFWGLRAYNATYATGLNSLADIVDTATGAASCTIKSDSSGNADLSSLSCVAGTLSVTTFCTVTHATGCSVSKLYDQTGNGRHVVQATLATMPTLVFSTIGSLPGIHFSGSQNLQSAAGVTQAQPFYVAFVAERTSVVSFANVFSGGNSSVQDGFGSGANVALAYAGSVVNGTASDNSYHVVQIVQSNTGATVADLRVDGTSVSTSAQGTGSLSGFNVLLGSTQAPDDWLTGNILEVGVWAGNQSASNTALCHNDRLYWGTGGSC